MRLQTVENSPGPVKSRQTKKSRRFKRTILWLKFILTIGLTVICAVLLALSPLFNIRLFEVTGNKYYDSAELTDASGIKIGDNGFKSIGSSVGSILSLRFGNIEKRLKESHPYIKDIKVRFAVPSKIRIELIERQSMAVVPYLGTSLLIDKEGYVLGTMKSDEKSELPLIKGLKFESYELGKELKVENKTGLLKVFKVMTATADSDREDKFNLSRIINSVDVSEENRVCLSVDSRITVNFGDLKDINYRIRVLKQLLVKNLKASDRGLLDFTTGENPVFMPDSGT